MGDRFPTRRIWLPILIAAGFALLQTAGRTQDRTGESGPAQIGKAPAARPDVRKDDDAGLRRLSAELKHLRSIGDAANAAKVFAQIFSLEAVPDPAAALKIGASARSNRVDGAPGNIKDIGPNDGTSPVFFSPEDEKDPSAAIWNSGRGEWELFAAAEQWAGGQPRDIRVRKSSDSGLTWTETIVVGDGRPWTQPSLRQVSDQTIGMVFVRDWASGDGDVFFARLSEDLTTDAECPVTLGQADQRNPSLATDYWRYAASYLYIVYAESDGLTRSVKFRVSPDLGVTWSRALTIASFSGPDGPDIQTALVYDPDRNALHVAFSCPQGRASGIAVASSTTFGASWSDPVFVTPEDNEPDSSPRIAAKRGTVLVVYEHETAAGGADIGSAGSSDSGRSWASGASLASTAAAERFPDIQAVDGTGAPRFFASFVESGARVHLLRRDPAGLGTWTTEQILESDGGPIESGPVVVVPMPAQEDGGSAGVFWAHRNPDYDIRFGSVLALHLTVVPPNQDVPCTAGTTSFAVDKTGKGRIDWSAAVTSGQDWLSIRSGSSGSNTGTIVADYQENTDVSPRAGSIKVTPTDGRIPSVTVTVTQAGPPVLEVTPADGLASTGPEGGSFEPPGKSYTLQNTGGTALDWTATPNTTWIAVSPASGTLDPGVSTTVTLSTSTAAEGLAAGSYDGVVTFTNGTNGSGSTTRTVSLTVTAPAGSLAVTPAGGLAAEGLAGGPFTPSSQSYTLRNFGTTSIDWTAVKSAAWTTLSASYGELTAGASTVVTVSISAAAVELSAGTYDDTVAFTNTTNGVGTTIRTVTLTVSAPPGALSVTPAEGLTSAGPVGGPFAPASRDYALQNTGGATIAWTASAGRTWVTVLPASGDLAGGAAVTVRVSIGSGAIAMAEGTYNDDVIFANTTNGTGSTTRPVFLTIRQLPVLEVLPSSRDVPFTGGTTVFDVSNMGGGTINWTAAVLAGGGWLSIASGGSGVGSGPITAAFSTNRASSTRVGIIRVTAAGAAGSPKDVTVIQAGGSITLSISGQRLVEKAWIIQREYGRLTVSVVNPAGVPVSTYRVFRKSGSQAYLLLQEVAGSAVGGSPWTANDAFLESGTSYTYKVVAYDALGDVITESNEITI